MAESLWWAYGVIAAPASVSPELRGIDGHRVELVEQGSLAGLASPVPAEEFSEAGLERRLNDLDALGRMARAHEMVLRRALADGDVLPFRMCTLYVTRDALRDMLAAERERLLTAFERGHGAIELGVKAFAAAPPRDASAPPASGTEYLAARLAQRKQAAVGEA